MKRMRCLQPTFSAVLCALAYFASAAITPGNAGTLTEEQRTRADRIESLSIPSAGEFFAALTKTERPNWAAVPRAAVPMGTTDRAQIALCLGVLIADAYIAVENQNTQEMKNIVRDLIEMARKLNAGDNVAGRRGSLTDFAENNEWNSLQEEIEATRNEIKISLVDQKDDDLVFLVSMGIWLRAMQATSTLVEINYTQTSAALLEQSLVAKKFLQRLDSLPDRMKGSEMTGKIWASIRQMEEEMVPGEGGVLSFAQVEKIRKISSEAVDRITGTKAPETAMPTTAEPTTEKKE